MSNIYELPLIAKLNSEEKRIIIERAFRKKDESHEMTKAFIEKNFATEESLNNKLEELVKEGHELTAARIRYLVAFKEVPNASKFIDEEIIEETKERFSLSTDIREQFKQEPKIVKLINDDKEKRKVREFIEEVVVDRWNLDDTSNEYVDVMVKAHFTYLIYDMLFTEEIDLYDLYAQYIKPPAPRFSVVLQEDEYVLLELIRVLLSKRGNKTVNNTKIMGLLLENYYNNLLKTYHDEEVSMDLIQSIVIDKINKEFNKN